MALVGQDDWSIDTLSVTGSAGLTTGEIYENHAFFGTIEGNVVSVDLSNHRVDWSETVSKEMIRVIVPIDLNNLIVGDRAGHLIEIKLSDK